MPYVRPPLSQLRAQVAADIAAGLPGTDALLPDSNLAITGDVQAALAQGIYGYLDWIAKQAVPYTAEGEFLEGWAALKDVFREPAVAAGSAAGSPGKVTFTGTNGVAVPDATPVTRGDGVAYVTSGAVSVSGGAAIVNVVAVEAGAAGNAVVGVAMTLGVTIAGMTSTGAVSTAITGGADVELDDSLRARMLEVYAAPPQGGDATDYPQWSREVPGVTRAWCLPNGMGVGTVIVYFMMDEVEAAFDGFPQGANGVAAGETRSTAATGDQLLVANHIFDVQPVTALVFASAPTAHAVNFTLTGLSGASAATKAAVEAAIDDVFFREGAPGGTVDLSLIDSGIAAVAGTQPFVMTSPTSNITSVAGAIPVRGTVTYA